MIIQIISVGMHVLLTFVKAHGIAASRIGSYFFSSFTGGFAKKAVEGGIMSTKHLKTGDALPAFNGTLRVYNMRFCPYAQRTILVLNAKDIPYEVVNVNLVEKPDWLFIKSPLGGKVPSVEIADGVVVYESLVTADFIDELYPQRPLNSKDPLRKAQDRIIVEHFSTFVTTFFKVLFKPEDVDDALVKQYFEKLEFLQSTLKKRGTEFLYGDQPGMPDYMIWPWIERLDLLNILVGDQFKLDDKRFATLKTWIEKMMQDPAVKEYFLDIDYHVKYIKTRKEGNPDFDMPLPKL